jgi:hypothetical protein
MAKLNQETIEIKISEMLRDSDSVELILDADTLEQLIAVIEQLVGDKKLVEVTYK